MRGASGLKEAKEGQEGLDEDKMNAIISDIIMNYRTVISFGQKNVDKIVEKYNILAKGPLDRSQKK